MGKRGNQLEFAPSDHKMLFRRHLRNKIWAGAREKDHNLMWARIKKKQYVVKPGAQAVRAMSSQFFSKVLWETRVSSPKSADQPPVKGKFSE